MRVWNPRYALVPLALAVAGCGGGNGLAEKSRGADLVIAEVDRDRAESDLKACTENVRRVLDLRNKAKQSIHPDYTPAVAFLTCKCVREDKPELIPILSRDQRTYTDAEQEQVVVGLGRRSERMQACIDRESKYYGDRAKSRL